MNISKCIIIHIRFSFFLFLFYPKFLQSLSAQLQVLRKLWQSVENGRILTKLVSFSRNNITIGEQVPESGELTLVPRHPRRDGGQVGIDTPS